MKYLVIGDYHATYSELDECNKLADFIISTLVGDDSLTALFLGDQFNDFSVINLHVLAFWQSFFERIQKTGRKAIALVGNHDQPGDGSIEKHALMAFKNIATIVDSPYENEDALFLPYYHTNAEFIVNSMTSQKKTVFAHQAFYGGVYDNGLKIREGDGIDPSLVPQSHIISGHIHSPQEFGKVWHIGAPRARTRSDANIDRNLWIVEIDGFGEIVNKSPLPLKSICKQIVTIKDTSDSQPTIATDSNIEYRIDIYGDESYIIERKSYYKQFTNVRFRTIPTQIKPATVKESDGIEMAFAKFVSEFKPKYNTDKQVLAKLIKDRLDIDVG